MTTDSQIVSYVFPCCCLLCFRSVLAAFSHHFSFVPSDVFSGRFLCVFHTVFSNVFSRFHSVSLLFSDSFGLSFLSVLRTFCLVLFAEEVDKGDKRVGEPHGLLSLVPQIVRAQRDQNPNSVVKFVLAVHVQHKLARLLRQLQHPKQLLRPGEARTINVELSGVLLGDA